MHRLSKRLCAILLTLCAVIGFLPMTSQAALVDSDDYIFQSLTLGGALQMNLLGEEATVNKYIDQGSVEITYPIGMDRKNTETKLYDEVNDTTQKTGKDGTLYRCATVDRVVAQMSDEIELVVKSSDLGVEVINQTYSIRDYLITLLNGIQTSQTKDLCLELLNYGAWAQKYFNYNIENLANEGYEVDHPKNAIRTTDIPQVTAEDNLQGIDFYGTTVVFLSNAAVRFYFKAPNGVKNYTFKVDKKEYQPRAKSGLYFIEIPNINPQDMSNALSVTVTDNNSTNELSFSYTPTWFFIRSYDKAKSDTEKETYAELMKAAYSYYVEAKAYDKCVVTDADELDLTYISGNANSITVKTNLSYSPDMAVTSDLITGISQTQDATDVDVSNVDSMAALTFTFGNEFAVGDTYSMPKGMAFVIDNQEYILKEDYVFQLAATGEDTYIWNTVEPVETVDVLMGFNDYSEITGADTGVKLSVGNMIGRMDINVDPRYVSEDVASLKVQPQGNFGNPGMHPYIKLDMSGAKYTGWEGKISQITSHADFSGYKSLSFDAFNPESTAQKVRMSLMILSGDSYITTIKQTYTLQPGLWNTCTYDLSVMAGFSFYDLKHVRFVVFEFLDHKESKDDVPPVLYIDDLVGNVYQDGEDPVYTDYSYNSGVGFETRGQEYLFVGQGNIEQDATIERVSYASLDIGTPANSGSYAVKLSHESNSYPTFRIHFGETLPKDTVVTFSAYGKINGSSQYNQSIFEFSGGVEATAQFPCDVWTDLQITLQDAAEYVDLFWNIDRAGIISETASGEVYLDNIKVGEIEREGSILDGLRFEKIGNKKFFGATGDTKTDAEPKIVPYASLGINAPTNGSESALVLTQDGNHVTSRIDFGEELPAGTEITFMVYGTHTGGSRSNEFEVGDREAESLTENEWVPVSYTLTQKSSYLDINWKINYWLWNPTKSVTLYVDNVKAVVPAVTPVVGLWSEGIDFETEGNEGLFVGQGITDSDFSVRRVAYTELEAAGIPKLADGGTYALRLGNGGHKWPTIRIYNTEEELDEGIVIAFQIYVAIDGADTNDKTKFEFSASSGSGKATEMFACGTWHTMTITLPNMAEYYDLFLNVENAVDAPNSCQVYLDNFTIVSGGFAEGVGFEEIFNTGLFTGQGAADDAILARVSYAAAGITADSETYGTYGLKLSNVGNDRWPKFRVNFGEELPAGTLITFDAYSKLLAGNATWLYSIFEYTGVPNGNGEATRSLNYNEWTKLYFVLNETTDHLDLFWNIDRAEFKDATSSAEVYLDNFLAVVPATSASHDLNAGLDFEDEEDGESALLIAKPTEETEANKAVITRIPYSITGITAPANGGEYALRLSNQSFGYPTFRLNFGTTLTAGTTITFDAYADYTSWHSVDQAITMLAYSGDQGEAKHGDSAGGSFGYKQWKTISFTLTSDTDHVDLFWNINDNADITIQNNNAHLYLDNIRATKYVEPEGDFFAGVDFEEGNEGNVGLFTGTGSAQDATIARVSYADAGVAATTNGGAYALKLSQTTEGWPHFRINFGTTLKAGTTITFDAYGNYNGAAVNGNKYMKLELTGDAKNYATTADPNQIVWTLVETWNTGCTVTLTQDVDHLDLQYNVADGQGSHTSSWMLLDNFLAVEPAEISGNIQEGLDFETSGNELHFGGVDGSESYRNVTIERVSYAEVTTSQALSTGGSYAMKLSHDSNRWPLFRINFGETLPAGTTITFDVLGYVPDAYKTGNIVKIGVLNSSQAYAQGTINATYTDAVLYATYNTWTTGCTVKLIADCSYVDLQFDVSECASADPASSYFLVDNVKATVPLVFTGDFETGVGLEDKGDIVPFKDLGTDYASRNATIERVAYADMSIGTPSNGGNYALKLSHSNNGYPTFQIDFGKTLPAGTQISFDAYPVFDGWTAGKAIALEAAGTTKTNGDIQNNIGGWIEWIECGVWSHETITLLNACDHIELFYNMTIDVGELGVASALYLDNVKATVPVYEAADFEAGVTFETNGHQDSFTGITDTQAAIVERVAYADMGVNSDGRGNYALKLSHASDCWPHFRINFGKTLPAGTVITFDAYGNYDYVAAAGVNKYMKVQLVGSNATSSNSEQLIWTLVDTWKTCDPITLTADSDHLDLMYNVADSSHGNVPSWLLLDNIKAVVPEMAFINGVTFEEEIGTDLFDDSTAWNAATAERVSYADMGLTDVPAERGEYALRYSYTGENAWPAFRINFGRTLSAGTTITFDVYGNNNYEVTGNNYMKVQLSSTTATSQNSEQLIWMLVGTWGTVDTITLTEDCSYLDFFYNILDGGISGSVDSYILVDNIKAVEPIGTGLSFEFAHQADYFTGTDVSGQTYRNVTIERVSYADAGVSALNDNGGTYALKLSHATNAWPIFRINFGKTLSAGTTITFDVYGCVPSESVVNGDGAVKIDLFGNSKNTAKGTINSTYTDLVRWAKNAQWTENCTIVLTADCSYLDLNFNIAELTNEGSGASYFLLDNLKVTAAS